MLIVDQPDIPILEVRGLGVALVGPEEL